MVSHIQSYQLKKWNHSYERRDKPGRGDGRPNSKPSGMNDPYGIDIALLNIFEHQVIPVGFITCPNRSDQTWLQSVCYLWALSLFQNGGTLILNKLSGNLEISREECKTVCFFRKHLRERFV